MQRDAVPIQFGHNLSGAAEIETHLTACSDRFIPPLAGRVIIPDYAAKLAQRAERFEAWSADTLVGLVAVYCPAATPARGPDAEARRPPGDAFVSNVSVLPSYSNRGIARELLAKATAYSRTRAVRIVLEVDRRAPALRLYEASGFAVEAVDGDTLTLARLLA
ncbi:GNAT family N-acetyltransferase [Methylobacterium persicinum]|uniref:Ribosomal protein S18 acetylase RimI-like enzyme n=1 Tax=Methylobacterium persicinum TaxID=374426 RepID=A0ABU0HIB0_9HYPH|nr:GNAT family N-acetyltransferase [Methylobacterium persicinum]MDQ0442068.1 ribosomal protein S18 acetylase RimI-like enzyme [Methylobacterium persicinum]GJE38833.1 hypothetical protein KHHGKMAE_2908 [Methylobacterium persicinum]